MYQCWRCVAWEVGRCTARAEIWSPQGPFIPPGRAEVAEVEQCRDGNKQHGCLGVVVVGTGSILSWPDGCFFWVQ